MKKKRIRKWYFGMLYFQQQSINITINHGAQIWCICYAKNVLRAIRFGKSWTIALMCQYNAKEYNVNQISSTCLLYNTNILWWIHFSALLSETFVQDFSSALWTFKHWRNMSNWKDLLHLLTKIYQTHKIENTVPI